VKDDFSIWILPANEKRKWELLLKGYPCRQSVDGGAAIDTTTPAEVLLIVIILYHREKMPLLLPE
jgi:hypothetical protein